MKTLILKPNEFWRENRADFCAYDGDKEVGRIYFGAGSSGQPRWLWAVYGWGSDLADTLDEAKAALKAQYLTM